MFHEQPPEACVLKHQCFTIDLLIHPLPAGGAAGAGDIAVSPVTDVNKSALRSGKLLYQALQEHKMKSMLF